MNFNRILTVIALLVLVLLAISFFLPKNMNLAVTKQLNASPEQVFVQINELKNWVNWSPWDKMDPDMELSYGERTIGEGGSYAWKSEKKGVGSGALIITESIPNEKLSTNVKFEGYDDAYGTFLISPSGEGSEVTWDFSSEYKPKWPWSKYGTLLGRMMLKKQYDAGLANIDQYVSENPEAHLAAGNDADGGGNEIAIVEKEVEAFNAVAVPRSGNISDMAENGEQIYGQAFGEVGQMIGEQGLTQSGMPFTQGISWDEENGTYEIEIGIPVENGGKVYGGGKVVMASYYGPYEGVGVAHAVIEAYCKSNALEIRGGPWEIYANDPGLEPDSSKWLTEVYYPVN